MNIIIVGDGKVGAALATQMSAEGHDVTIIDSNPQVLSESAERLDIMAVIGNGVTVGKGAVVPPKAMIESDIQEVESHE